MAELQRFIWSWETILARLRADDPVGGYALGVAARPIAAERASDGRLLLVLGAWYAAHRDALRDDQQRELLTDRLARYLEDRLELRVVDWPGGMVAEDEPSYARSRALLARARREPGAVELPEAEARPPPIVRSESEEALAEASACESAIQRFFFDRALRRGTLLRCQHRVRHCRLDFAIPARRVGADVVGWDARLGPRQRRLEGNREREDEIASEGWRVLTFSGSEVHRNPGGCVGELLALAERRGDTNGRARGPIRDPRLENRRNW